VCEVSFLAWVIFGQYSCISLNARTGDVPLNTSVSGSAHQLVLLGEGIICKISQFGMKQPLFQK
jgi:hypothetical protein